MLVYLSLPWTLSSSEVPCAIHIYVFHMFRVGVQAQAQDNLRLRLILQGCSNKGKPAKNGRRDTRIQTTMSMGREHTHQGLCTCKVGRGELGKPLQHSMNQHTCIFGKDAPSSIAGQDTVQSVKHHNCRCRDSTYN